MHPELHAEMHRSPQRMHPAQGQPPSHPHGGRSSPAGRRLSR